MTLDDFLPFVGNVPPPNQDRRGRDGIGRSRGCCYFVTELLSVLHVENTVKDSPRLLQHLAKHLGYDKIFWDIHMIYQPSITLVSRRMSSPPTPPAMSINVVALQSSLPEEVPRSRSG